jgi:metal-dependent hydrolase (beta-lactamase superfamily II)
LCPISLGTLELRELSLAINTPDGMVIVVGCSHPGIDKIVESATAIKPRIHFIAGGFHLVAAPDPDIERTVTALHDRFRVEYVAPVTAPESQRSRRLKRLSPTTTFMRRWSQH